MAEFNLKKIYQNAFGYSVPQAFSIDNAPARLERTKLGQQLYATDYLGREFFLPIFLNELLIPFAVMSMNWKKTIITTMMPERNGGVHEMISNDDISFNIKGLLIDEDGNFPDAGITDLFKLFSLNESVRMRSALSAIVLNDGYEHVVIKEMRWPSLVGVEHVRAFEMDLESDTAFTLEVE